MLTTHAHQALSINHIVRNRPKWIEQVVTYAEGCDAAGVEPEGARRGVAIGKRVRARRHWVALGATLETRIAQTKQGLVGRETARRFSAHGLERSTTPIGEQAKAGPRTHRGEAAHEAAGHVAVVTNKKREVGLHWIAHHLRVRRVEALRAAGRATGQSSQRLGFRTRQSITPGRSRSSGLH